MKKIVIFQENVSNIELVDLDDSDLSSYIKKLSSILELGSISILHTTSTSVVLRPNKVISILVNEEKSHEISEDAVSQKSEPVGLTELENEEEVDIITEGD